MNTYHLPLCGEQTYKNPLPFSTPKKTNPDPYVMEYCGLYYCYASGRDGVNVSCSPDLVHWTDLSYALSEPEKLEYWAPCALYHNGLFYLYYSCTNRQGNEDCHFEHLKVATSKNSEGPFVYQKTFFDHFSIDAHVVRDANGDLYLFYSPNDWAGCDEMRPGTVILADKMTDPLTLSGNPRPIVIPSVDDEIFEHNRMGDGRDWHTIEGAFYLEHCGNAYVMFSANCYQRENYYVGYSMAPKTAPIDALAFVKSGGEYGCDPLLRRNESVEGTGHNSVAKAPNGMDDWVVYHGRNADDALIIGTEQREMRIDPLFFSGGKMVCNAPSHAPQSAPYFPLYHKCFADSTPAQDAVLHTSEKNGVTQIIFAAAPAALRARVWLSATPQHSGARYGVVLNALDESNYLRARFDSGSNTLALLHAQNGFVRCVAQVRLFAGFDHAAVHCVQAMRCGDDYSVIVDGMPLLHAQLAQEAGAFGVFGSYTPIALHALSITQGVHLWGEQLRLLGGLFTASNPITVQQARLLHVGSADTQLRRNTSLPQRVRVTLGVESFGGTLSLQLGALIVCVKGQTYDICEGERVLASGAVCGAAFSVTLTRWDTQAWLRVDSDAIALPPLAGNLELIMQLKKAAIVEYTEICLS